MIHFPIVLAYNKKNVLYHGNLKLVPIFQQKKVVFYGIIHYAQIHTYDARVERTPLMSDTEAKILELIQGLTLTQQMDALNHALEMLAATQETPPAPVETSD